MYQAAPAPAPSATSFTSAFIAMILTWGGKDENILICIVFSFKKSDMSFFPSNHSHRLLHFGRVRHLLVIKVFHLPTHWDTNLTQKSSSNIPKERKYFIRCRWKVADLSFEEPHQYDCLAKDKEHVDQEDGVEVNEQAVEIVADLEI